MDPPTDGGGLKAFLQQLDDCWLSSLKRKKEEGSFSYFYLVTGILFYNRWKETFGKLQMHCSEFHEWLIHLNTENGALYCPYTLVPDSQNFSNFLQLWGLRHRGGKRKRQIAVRIQNKCVVIEFLLENGSIFILNKSLPSKLSTRNPKLNYPGCTR